MDTSAWIDGWHRDYPPDVFPSIWDFLDGAILLGTIISTEEVYKETQVKDDDLHNWLKKRKWQFIPISEEIQSIARDLLFEFPGLVDFRRKRSQADPFVIATAIHMGGVVVTGEIASKKPKKPKIPDVCIAKGIRCIKFLDMLRELNYKF